MQEDRLIRCTCCPYPSSFSWLFFIFVFTWHLKECSVYSWARGREWGLEGRAERAECSSGQRLGAGSGQSGGTGRQAGPAEGSRVGWALALARDLGNGQDAAAASETHHWGPTRPQLAAKGADAGFLIEGSWSQCPRWGSALGTTGQGGEDSGGLWPQRPPMEGLRLGVGIPGLPVPVTRSLAYYVVLYITPASSFLN